MHPWTEELETTACMEACSARLVCCHRNSFAAGEGGWSVEDRTVN